MISCKSQKMTKNKEETKELVIIDKLIKLVDTLIQKNN